MVTATTFVLNLMNKGLEYFKRYYGVYYGICEDNEDPEESGRILVRVPAVTGTFVHSVWAPPIAPWGGDGCGFFCVPDKKDPVWVTFENGNKNCPQWMGGWWPKTKEKAFADGLSPYTDGKPSKRIFKTKAGHELSFEDNADAQSVKLLWHDAAQDTTSSLIFDNEGTISLETHKGSVLEMRSTDDDEQNILTDPHGNTIIQDADGVRIMDVNDNIVELKSDLLQLLGAKNIVLDSDFIGLTADSIEAGNNPTDMVIKGDTFLDWITQSLKVFLTTHTHPTPVGPSGPSANPFTEPIANLVLSGVVKVE